MPQNLTLFPAGDHSKYPAGRFCLFFLIKALFTLFLGTHQVGAMTLDDTLKTVLKYIDNEYIYDVTETALTESAISGILKDLDPYCRYLDPQKFLHWRYQSLGELAGIGVEVIVEEGGLRIITIYDDTPASKVPLKPGDFITKIDQTTITGKEKSDITTNLLGLPDSSIMLEIRRHHKIFTVTLQRALIQIPTITWYTERKIGYVRINIFDSRTEGALNHAIHQMKERLGVMQGLILDLRNNGGGSVESAVQVSDAFLDKGNIVIVKGKGDKIIDCYQARSGDILQGLPMVVLINNASASASEIVAGALQARERAQILGIASYGKGIGQKMIPLENGGAIFLTVEQYFTPIGNKINGRGVEPDFVVPAEIKILVPSSGSADQNKLTEISSEKEILKNGAHLENIPFVFEQDYQLRRAVDVLRTQYFLREKKDQKGN